MRRHHAADRSRAALLHEIAPELTGHGLPLGKCEAYNRVYDQFYQDGKKEKLSVDFPTFCERCKTRGVRRCCELQRVLACRKEQVEQEARIKVLKAQYATPAVVAAAQQEVQHA